MAETGVFLDTTIQIARVVHGPRTKGQIRRDMASFDYSVTSLVVWQEFKRRLLKEAKYLLNLLNVYDSFGQTMRHIIDRLPIQQQRKQKICLETLQSIFEHNGRTRGDAELTERAQRTLRNLIRLGLRRFEHSVDSILRDCDCACAKQTIIEKIPYKSYEFGTDKCSRLAGSCGISRFLQSKRTELEKIQIAIQSLPEAKKTRELAAVAAFISKVVGDAEDATKADPCYKVGDLLIALESSGIPRFYTMNAKESEVLCPALAQKLVIMRVSVPELDRGEGPGLL